MIRSRLSSWFARRPAAPRRPGVSVRSALETLEDRVVPNATTFPTTTAITGVSTTYNLTKQIDAVSVQVSSSNPITGAPLGQVAVQDNGQVQTVTLGPDGTATATFAFNLFSSPPHGQHRVTALYPGGEDQHGNVFTGSFGEGTAPDTTSKYNAQILIDYLIVLYLSQFSTTAATP
jgi:hypothetical protein